jgi:glycosyltransferase involved in cell wall biosynthesis
MQPLFNILICHKIERYDYLKQLNAALDPQIDKFNGKVVVLIDDSRYKSIGKKRNDLLIRADAKYVAFFDDDDLPGPNYVKLIMEGIKQNVDCCELIGEITDDGKNPRKFLHSLNYDSWFERDGVYYRPPNHLNAIKSEIAKQFRFPEKNHGEDHDWSMQIQKSGLLKTQFDINETIYHYKCRSDEYERQELVELRRTNG